MLYRFILTSFLTSVPFCPICLPFLLSFALSQSASVSFLPRIYFRAFSFPSLPFLSFLPFSLSDFQFPVQFLYLIQFLPSFKAFHVMLLPSFVPSLRSLILPFPRSFQLHFLPPFLLLAPTSYINPFFPPFPFRSLAHLPALSSFHPFLYSCLPSELASSFSSLLLILPRLVHMLVLPPTVRLPVLPQSPLLLPSCLSVHPPLLPVIPTFSLRPFLSLIFSSLCALLKTDVL